MDLACFDRSRSAKAQFSWSRSQCDKKGIIGTLLKEVVGWGRSERRWGMPLPRDPLSVPLPLEESAHAFDELFPTYLQRRRFRAYLAGLLVPRDRNKTLTALVGA